MQWLTAPNSDEHILCDDRGHQTEYRVRRDPVTGLYVARDGERRIMMRLALAPCQRACEELYAAERAIPSKAPINRKGRYSKRESAA